MHSVSIYINNVRELNKNHYLCARIMDKQIKITFIVNPISGTSDKRHIIDLIPKYLDSSRFRWTIRYTEHKGHAAQFVGEAIEEGMDVVVAVGGDGTVNEVAWASFHAEAAMDSHVTSIFP